MFKKCMAKCYAGPDKNLYLRGKIFYYMIELPRVNGRNYFSKIDVYIKNGANSGTFINSQSVLTNY